MAPHILLEEIGAPYQRVPVDKENGGHKTPAYLALNPNGLIPVLVDGDLVLYETAAICLHLSDTHPQAGLMPALGTVERAHAYKWLMWLTNTLQATLIVYFYPHRWVNEGSDTQEEVKAVAKQRIDGLLDQLDTELARHGGPWFLGRDYSLLDAYVFTLCRWTRYFQDGLPPVRPARERQHLGPYLQRMLARPALQRVMLNEALSPPYV